VQSAVSPAPRRRRRQRRLMRATPDAPPRSPVQSVGVASLSTVAMVSFSTVVDTSTQQWRHGVVGSWSARSAAPELPVPRETTPPPRHPDPPVSTSPPGRQTDRATAWHIAIRLRSACGSLPIGAARGRPTSSELQIVDTAGASDPPLEAPWLCSPAKHAAPRSTAPGETVRPPVHPDPPVTTETSVSTRDRRTCDRLKDLSVAALDDRAILRGCGGWTLVASGGHTAGRPREPHSHPALSLCRGRPAPMADIPAELCRISAGISDPPTPTSEPSTSPLEPHTHRSSASNRTADAGPAARHDPAARPRRSPSRGTANPPCVPALSIASTGPDDNTQHRADTEWQVRAVTSEACGTAWFRDADLHRLVEGIAADAVPIIAKEAGPAKRITPAALRRSTCDHGVERRILTSGPAVTTSTGDLRLFGAVSATTPGTDSLEHADHGTRRLAFHVKPPRRRRRRLLRRLRQPVLRPTAIRCSSPTPVGVATSRPAAPHHRRQLQPLKAQTPHPPSPTSESTDSCETSVSMHLLTSRRSAWPTMVSRPSGPPLPREPPGSVVDRAPRHAAPCGSPCGFEIADVGPSSPIPPRHPPSTGPLRTGGPLRPRSELTAGSWTTSGLSCRSQSPTRGRPASRHPSRRYRRSIT
jgi:hypothetical protein